jgi:polyphosphate kinase
VHFGTGNYHPVTAKSYTDLSFFTCDPALCQDAAYTFNYLTGYAPPAAFTKIALAPLTMRDALLQHVADEIAHARAGRPATIVLKVNALVDAPLIDALYAASQAGVRITAIVRGMCSLRPGVPGLSETIQVRSIVGRFLEHARLYCFGNGHAFPSRHAKVFMASADWMQRSFDRRVEVMIPIENPTAHAQTLDQIIMTNLKDTAQTWVLQPDGTYQRHAATATPFSAHAFFMTHPSLSGRGSAVEPGPKHTRKARAH